MSPSQGQFSLADRNWVDPRALDDVKAWNVIVELNPDFQLDQNLLPDPSAGFLRDAFSSLKNL